MRAYLSRAPNGQLAWRSTQLWESQTVRLALLGRGDLRLDDRERRRKPLQQIGLRAQRLLRDAFDPEARRLIDLAGCLTQRLRQTERGLRMLHELGDALADRRIEVVA